MARYRLGGVLGRGTLGTLYRVEDTSTGRWLALKRLGEPSTEQDRLRFRREFHTLAHLRHPSIAEVHEFGTDEAGLHYTRELLEGADLREPGRLPVAHVLEVLLHLSGALAFLHTRRLVHRDVTLDGVRMDASGRAKLVRFELLVTAGAAAEVAGTPPHVAPECLRGLPLDHRADLFALGALAYRLLTGRHAYPAERFEELEAAWAREIPPPGALRPDVPEPVDTLVMSLLSLDPARRPGSAVEVINRLGEAIGRPASARAEAASASLTSPPLVGRGGELAWIKRWVTTALSGDLKAVVLDSAPGMGKTRLLAELALEAQLSGARVLRADGNQPLDAPYAVIRQLLQDLFRTDPELGLRTVAAHAAYLVRVLPELADRLGRTHATPPMQDPNEERARLQNRLASWFLETARIRPLVVLLDDAHHCDEASAAVLAALGVLEKRCPLLVALGLRCDVAPRAPKPIGAVLRRAHTLRLRGLELQHVHQMLRGMFGDLPRMERLASRFHRVTGGNPLHVVLLSRQMVEAGGLHRQDGGWHVPEPPGEGEVPRGLLAALSAQIQSFSLDARLLAESLCVHRGDLPLELCLRISGLEGDRQLFHAIDELVRREVLAEAGGRVRFLNGGFQEALRQSLPEGRRRMLHRRLGEALLSWPGATGRDGEIGWHLLEGGEEARGAELLERAGRTLHDAQAMHECVAPLQAAIEVHERTGKPPSLVLELRYLLLVAGSIADFPAGMRQVEPLLTGCATWAGLLPSHPRSGPGLGWRMLRTWGRRLLTPRSHRGPGPPTALLWYLLTSATAATMAGLLHDVATLGATIADLERLPRSLPGLAALLLYLRTFHAYVSGKFREVEMRVEEALAMLRGRWRKQLPDLQRRILEATMRLQAMTGAIALGNAAEYRRQLEATERIDLRMFDGHLALARAQFHRARGEEDMALEFESQAEVFFLRTGTVWGAEIQRPVSAALAYLGTRDLFGLRRSIEELDHVVARGGRYGGLRDMIVGVYHRERGELDVAMEALRRARAQQDPAVHLFRQDILVAIAETQLARGLCAEARSTAEEARTLDVTLDLGYLATRARTERVLALAEAADGDPAAGAARLDRALEAVAAQDLPVVAGSLHEARALVALMQGDAGSHRDHGTKMERLFACTRNPVLVARAHHILQAGGGERARSRTHLAALAVTTPARPPLERVRLACSGRRGGSWRLDRALEVLVWESAGARGFLYLVRDGRLTLVAPLRGEEPAGTITEELGRRLSRPVAPGTPLDLPGGDQWLPLVLSVRQDGESRAVAAAAILKGPLPFRTVPEAVLVQLGEELHGVMLDQEDG